MLELEHSGGIRAFVRFAGRFLANESQPARRATPMPSARNARTRRSHVVAAARISQRCIRTALPRRVGRIPAAFRRPSNGNTKGHESSIRWSRTLPSLCGGSQQRIGRTHIHIARIARQVRTNQAPLAAKGRPMRTPKWRFAVGHGRHQPRSLAQRQHPSRSPHERLEPSGFAAERRPHTCRIPTAIQWQPRRVSSRQSDDPGPCRRCAAVLSSSADASAYISLGSHAKSGPPMRRSPRKAVPCGHRNDASLSATDATNPAAWRRGSTHPDHRMRGGNRVASPRRDGRIPAAF